ncbi:organic hydroperoxide resistance protein [Jatrophihabitans lederbergiae]|uniref:Organic hydroperoxide resistance protein n=1 Tax=Jatrophihabitans lederbergiae TaxID=3075547 RepID=A0ABU2JB87_9ACTN|nr:organic hydroperoxide resistance protein [Jatrophihabitans sp. DSM 44399]MDT0262011.1 organic hydroperoxide resistance protein [Jatrophihabitans sp. DSM 44399]
MPIELKKVAYVTSATAKGGRAGHVRSADGLVDFELAQPGSTPEPAVNPETLFAAGYASCFQGALENRAKTKGVDTSGSTVTANVSFGPSEDGGFGLAVELEVSIPGVEAAQAQELVELAHQFCPYSKATRDNIVVTLTVA